MSSAILSYLWRCPRCGAVRSALIVPRSGVVSIAKPRRMICPLEGADMRRVTVAECEAICECILDGHPREPWQDSCPCRMVRA